MSLTTSSLRLLCCAAGLFGLCQSDTAAVASQPARALSVGTVPPLGDLIAPSPATTTELTTIPVTQPIATTPAVALVTAAPTAAPASGGTPTWVWILVFLVVALVCGAGGFFAFTKLSGDKAAKKGKKTKRGAPVSAAESPGSKGSFGSVTAKDGNVYEPLPTSAMITPTYANVRQAGAPPATNLELGQKPGIAPPTYLNLSQSAEASLDRAAALETPTYRNLQQVSALAAGSMPATSPWLQGGPQYPGLPATGAGSLPQTSGVPPPTSAWLPGAGSAGAAPPTTQWLPGAAPPTSAWVPNQMPSR